MTTHRPPRVLRKRRATQRAQAVLETALVLPILLFLTCGFVGLMLQVQARQELDTATALAAEAAFQAPGPGGAASNSLALDYSATTFAGTMEFYSRYLRWQTTTSRGDHVDCRGPYFGSASAAVDAPPQAQSIECSAAVTLLLSRTPIGWTQLFGDPVLRSTAYALPPPFR
ncbi:MAG: TadE/TadG family type IV pilus assembly protein [Candidatus Dormibacteria bacterium]